MRKWKQYKLVKKTVEDFYRLENQTECNVGEISRTRKEISGQVSIFF